MTSTTTWGLVLAGGFLAGVALALVWGQAREEFIPLNEERLQMFNRLERR